MSTPRVGTNPAILKAGRAALLLGCILALPAIVEWVRDPVQFYRSYLVAFLFILAPALGSLAWILLHRLTGGRWGESVSDVLGAAAGTLPLLAICFLPVIIGLEKVFPWSEAGWREDHSATFHQAMFLQPAWFIVRAAIYLFIWGWLAWMVAGRRSSHSFVGRHPSAVGAMGLIAYFLTATLASVDWGMSLTPEWYSSIYGLLWILAQALSGLSLAILVRLFQARATGGEVATERLHDLGSLLFAGVMTWAYLSFSQFLIMWSANLPEEVTWYVSRLSSGWQGIGISLLVFHFALPFFLLLMRKFKRRAAYLAVICCIVFAARLPEVLWMIVPAFRPHGFPVHWLDLVLPMSLFAMWSSFLLRGLDRRLALEEPSPTASMETV